MDYKAMPTIFQKLCADGNIQESEVLKTKDGFCFLYKSVANILLQKGILDFPDARGERHACSKFFDDWFLYAVPSETDYTYSLLKLREQEHDAKDGCSADGDTPGVTISFIAFACEVLLDCLENPADENRVRLNREINRVVAYKGQSHHKDLKRYFVSPKAMGAYLVAVTYIRHIAAFAENGCLNVPEQYKEILQQSRSYKNSRKLARLPKFIEKLNHKAGCVVCDHNKIYIKDPQALTAYESAAILATHAGNISLYSFAAEVEYHAKYLTPLAKVKIPFFGRSIYDSAIRADMTVGDTEFEGPAPFYQLDSKIVKRHCALHQAEF